MTILVLIIDLIIIIKKDFILKKIRAQSSTFWSLKYTHLLTFSHKKYFYFSIKKVKFAYLHINLRRGSLKNTKIVQKWLKCINMHILTFFRLPVRKN